MVETQSITWKGKKYSHLYKFYSPRALNILKPPIKGRGIRLTMKDPKIEKLQF